MKPTFKNYLEKVEYYKEVGEDIPDQKGETMTKCSLCKRTFPFNPANVKGNIATCPVCGAQGQLVKINGKNAKQEITKIKDYDKSKKYKISALQLLQKQVVECSLCSKDFSYGKMRMNKQRTMGLCPICGAIGQISSETLFKDFVLADIKKVDTSKQYQLNGQEILKKNQAKQKKEQERLKAQAEYNRKEEERLRYYQEPKKQQVLASW